MSIANNNTWRVQQPVYKRETALTVTLVMLALLVILGGIGLTALFIYTYQRNNASQVVPASNMPALSSDQSPQELYTRITNTTPTLVDPLTHDDMLLFDGGTCSSYSMQGLSLSASSYRSGASMCTSTTANLSNFAFQVKMTIVRGDEGGLLFRVHAESVGLGMCMFSINTGGAFNMAILTNPWSTLLQRPDPAIKAGLGQSNVLTVIAQGKTVLLYANGHYLGLVTNASIPSSGNIGLIAYDLLDPTAVVFSNLRVWKL
jgi:hypothetical protein